MPGPSLRRLQLTDVRNEHVARLEHVLLHDELCALRVPGAERLRDLPVVVPRDPSLLRRVPDVRPVYKREHDHLTNHLSHPRASRRFQDRVVEKMVLLDEASDVAVGPRIEAIATGPEQRDDVLGHTRSRPPCSVALEQSPELVQILELVGVVHANGGAPVGSGVHEAFGLQQEQRLPNGCATDAELAGEALLLETSPRSKSPIDDGLPNHLRGDVARVANERLPLTEDLRLAFRHALGQYSMQSRSSGAARVLSVRSIIVGPWTLRRSPASSDGGLLVRCSSSRSGERRPWPISCRRRSRKSKDRRSTSASSRAWLRKTSSSSGPRWATILPTSRPPRATSGSSRKRTKPRSSPRTGRARSAVSKERSGTRGAARQRSSGTWKRSRPIRALA